jgi:phosphoglucosamine mutase
MMKPEKVFKRYDIRGEYPEELDEEFAERLGRSMASFCQRNFSRRIVVCRDNKESSAGLKESFTEGLKSSGMKIFDIGVGPTDYAAYTGKKHECVSVQVTSSHMPLNFNGFKFMYPEGNGFVNEDLEEVKDIFRSEEFEDGEGIVRDMASTSMRRYRDDLKMTAMRNSSSTIDKKVVVETMGGATKEVLPELLEGLGADVIDIGEEKERAPYRDPPNPKPEYLDEMVERVDEEEADLGIATDMDGDRITIYNGEFISGDDVFCILSQLVRGDAVASIDTSGALEELLDDRGDSVFYTRVGDPFVMDKALEEDVAVAGEPNGHYSVLDFVPYNSGTLTALMVAGTDIEQKMNNTPFYSTQRDSIEVENKEETMKHIREEIEDEDIISEKDGFKASIGYSDVLIRPSGSSSKIRVISHANEEDTAKAGLEEAAELVRNS